MKSKLPTVTVCTPTFNRRPFLATMMQNFRAQTYPRDRIVQWIILDDGTDKIGDTMELSRLEFPQMEYVALLSKTPLGKKRNMMHDMARGDILVYMDDDDYYPPERIEHAVQSLMANPAALCAGASEIYCYFKHIQKMVQFGPYGPNHATAGTFAFRRELLLMTRYDDEACLAEEKAFLKGYTIPFVQLDPRRTILVFSHEHNTYDKRKMLKQMGPQNPFVKESTWTVDDFIRLSSEAATKQFFLHDIDPLLDAYEPGKPEHKPDVLKQTKELEEQRATMMQQQQLQQQQQQLQQRTPIHVTNQETGEQQFLTMDQVVQLIRELEGRLASMHNTVMQQRQYIDQQAECIQMWEKRGKEKN